MAKELFNRYVWLIDLLQRYGRLTRREIDELWMRSEYSEGKPMARRTFMNYRQAIQEMFDVNIECDPSTYEYYIEDPEALEGSGARVWALNTLSVNTLLNESQELRDRIVLENIPSGQKSLRQVFEAMKESIGDKINAVRFTNKLKNHPVCLTSEGGISLEMEKVLNSMPGAADNKVKAQLVLEINASHPIAEKLKELYASDKELLGKYAKLLYGEACLIGGKSVPDPAEHSALVCELMVK